MSFASPESDMCGPDAAEISASIEAAHSAARNYTFAAPESDFSSPANAVPSHFPAPLEPSHLCFSTPESDFCASTLPEFAEQSLAHPVPYSFATPESDFACTAASAFVLSLPQTTTAYLPLNMALAQALAQDHAVVITEARPPFRITHVNQAWTSLCGFSATEAVGQTLDIIQGPGTRLRRLEEEIAGFTMGSGRESSVHHLRNYNKAGEAFRNRLTVSPVRSSGSVTHLVGTLQKM